MSTDAKRAGNARYLATMKTITVRIKPEEYTDIKAAAEKSNGGSVQGYFLAAAREKMSRDGFRPPDEDSAGNG